MGYCRMVDENCKVHCSFVMGKSRVAPISPVSVPRLELTSAVTAVRLAALIKTELEYDIHDVVYWADSTTVLQYVSNTASRFQTFVANRLEFIHRSSQPSQWRHVSTNTNPADIASRGLMPSEVHKAKIWLTGPEFLRQPEEKWPVRPVVLPPLSEDHAEFGMRKGIVFSLTQAAPDKTTLQLLFERYSTLSAPRRSVAWLLRFRKYLIWKSCRPRILNPSGFPWTGYLSHMELEEALLSIIKVVHLEVFAAEMKQLPNHESFSTITLHSVRQLRKSPVLASLQKLSPFVVDGVLYVGGRLHKSSQNAQEKHQIILPSRHIITDLIISYYHCRQGHSGTLHVLSAIRERFWILRGQASVRRVLRDCRKCKFWNARVGEQMMASLPVARVSAGRPPFTAVGVDYMGPILTKLGRSRVKRYGCIFTCMATRAIHIEVAESLETSAFIGAYRRFTCRRIGRPKQIFSDNGTNLVGAERELREGIRNWNIKQMHDAFLQDEISWNFNPPAASHQGGVWERMIRSVRKVMRSINGEKVLDDFGLLTLMAEIERILNDRPITPISDDHRDELALTPSMLLKGAVDDSLPPDEFLKSDGYKRSWRAVQLCADKFWERWTKEYLPLLQLRQKWLRPTRNFAVGDVVLVVDELKKRGVWPKGVIEHCTYDKTGLVRRVRVRTMVSTMERDVRKLCLLEAHP